MSKQKRSNYNVTPQQFVRAWTMAASPEDVAKEFGMPLQAVYARASLYRKKGVRLKEMPRRTPLDVEELNRIVDQVDAKDKAGVEAMLEELDAEERVPPPAPKQKQPRAAAMTVRPKLPE